MVSDKLNLKKKKNHSNSDYSLLVTNVLHAVNATIAHPLNIASGNTRAAIYLKNCNVPNHL